MPGDALPGQPRARRGDRPLGLGDLVLAVAAASTHGAGGWQLSGRGGSRGDTARCGASVRAGVCLGCRRTRVQPRRRRASGTIFQADDGAGEASPTATLWRHGRGQSRGLNAADGGGRLRGPSHRSGGARLALDHRAPLGQRPEARHRVAERGGRVIGKDGPAQPFNLNGVVDLEYRADPLGGDTEQHGAIADLYQLQRPIRPEGAALQSRSDGVSCRPRRR